MTTSTQEV